MTEIAKASVVKTWESNAVNDSGLVLICDPGYVMNRKDYKKYIDNLDAAHGPIVAHVNDLGIIIGYTWSKFEAEDSYGIMIKKPGKWNERVTIGSDVNPD